MKWMHTRDIVAKIHNSNIAKRSDARTPEQLYPLEIDKELNKLREKAQKEKRNKFKGKQFEKKKKQLERILKKVHGK